MWYLVPDSRISLGQMVHAAWDVVVFVLWRNVFGDYVFGMRVCSCDSVLVDLVGQVGEGRDAFQCKL